MKFVSLSNVHERTSNGVVLFQTVQCKANHITPSAMRRQVAPPWAVGAPRALVLGWVGLWHTRARDLETHFQGISPGRNQGQNTPPTRVVCLLRAGIP